MKLFCGISYRTRPEPTCRSWPPGERGHYRLELGGSVAG